MKRAREFRVLIASDGSVAAKAAVKTAVRFPWPDGARGYGVVAKEVEREFRLSVLLAALDQGSELVGKALMRTLARHWADAPVRVVDASPVDAIIAEAARIHVDAIVVGWRGHGAVRRLLAGSVSRGVVRRAACSVLVVRRARPAIQQIVVGFDGSDDSRRAVELIASCRHPSDGRATLVTVTGNMHSPLLAFMQTTSAEVATEVWRIHEERAAGARKEVDRAALRLSRAGWDVATLMTQGAPLRDLLATVVEKRADLLVVGARGAAGSARSPMGSVAESALSRSPVPVLVVR